MRAPVRLLGYRAAVVEVGLGGGQNFTALIDTGSGNLVVASSDCASKGCQGHRRFRLEEDEAGRLAANVSGGEIQLSFSGAHLAGNGFESRVCLSNACGHASFVLAAWESDGFRDLGFDAILGLGPPRQAVAQGFSVLGALAGQAALPSASFVLSLRSDGSSSATFGALAPPSRSGHALERAGLSAWLPVDRKHGEWAVHLKDIVVDGKRTGACPHEGCRAVLDTGCPGLALPALALERIRARWPPADCSPASIAALPTLRLAWGNGSQEHEVPPERYVDVSPEDPLRCRLLVSSAEGFGGRTAVLGLPFFVGRDVAFDQELMRIGITDVAEGKAPARRRPAASVARGSTRPPTALDAFLGR